MPMSQTSLRVFEPRYKQMMDDCILGSRPFGYITYDPKVEDIGGWTQPAKYGVVAEIEEYQESGSNIMINVISGLRFKSVAVIQPLLENNVDEAHFPTVDELMEKAEGPQDGKLYLTCEAEIMDPIYHNHDQNDFEYFVEHISPLSNFIEVSCLYRGQQIDYEVSISSTKPEDQELFMWQVSASLSNSVEIQQQMLSSITTMELMQVCLESANDIIEAIAQDE